MKDKSSNMLLSDRLFHQHEIAFVVESVSSRTKNSISELIDLVENNGRNNDKQAVNRANSRNNFTDSKQFGKGLQETTRSARARFLLQQ